MTSRFALTQIAKRQSVVDIKRDLKAIYTQ